MSDTILSPLTVTSTLSFFAFAIASVKDLEIVVCLEIESFKFFSACSTSFLNSSSLPGVKVSLISLSNLTPDLEASSITLVNRSLAFVTNSVKALIDLT